MTDQELRALVRDAVQRHLGARPAPPMAAPGHAALASFAPAAAAVTPAHPSHALYLTVVNTSEACTIESAVPCDHCGYCKSHGH